VLKRLANVSTRLGIALAETLVALGLMCVLVALLLPRLQSFRERSRAASCQHNLARIGNALENYHQVHGQLPPGYFPSTYQVFDNGAIRWPGRSPSYSWAAFLLLHLGYEDLSQALGIDKVSLPEVIEDAERRRLLQSPVSVYRCPSDPSGETLESSPLRDQARVLDRAQYDQGVSIYGGTSTYVANGGYFELNHPAFLPPSSPMPAPAEGEEPRTGGARLASQNAIGQNAGQPSTAEPSTAKPRAGGRKRSPGPRPTGDNNGVMYVASRVTFAQITDGRSNTIAVGERAWFQGSSTWVGSDGLHLVTAAGTGTCLGRVYWKINEIPTSKAELAAAEIPELATHVNGVMVPSIQSARNGFGSYHPDGAYFLMADGAVRFLGNGIDFANTITMKGAEPESTDLLVDQLGLFQRLGIRNDGVNESMMWETPQ